MVFSLTAYVISVALLVMTTVGIPGLLALMAWSCIGVPIPPLPSEIIMAVAGILTAQGVVGSFGIPFNWVSVTIASSVGWFIGAVVGYYIGFRFGMPFIKTVGRKVYLREEDLTNVERFFERRGEYALLIARTVPLIRSYISYPAGAAKMNFTKYSVFTVVGSFPYNILCWYAGLVLGEHFFRFEPYFTYVDIIAVIAAIVMLGIFFRRRLRQRAEKALGRSGQAPPP